MIGTFNFATEATFAVLVLYAVGPGSAMGLSGPAFGLLMATSPAAAWPGRCWPGRWNAGSAASARWRCPGSPAG
ncbi:hypothetical protein AB0L41_47925 [Amycolatopsis mediterranei]|uniref:hypothetical protein n=1 Tax=Amycolatopsis mediterranei TaxID=33910 RepID=UPI00342BB5D8